MEPKPETVEACREFLANAGYCGVPPNGHWLVDAEALALFVEEREGAASCPDCAGRGWYSSQEHASGCTGDPCCGGVETQVQCERCDYRQRFVEAEQREAALLSEVEDWKLRLKCSEEHSDVYQNALEQTEARAHAAEVVREATAKLDAAVGAVDELILKWNAAEKRVKELEKERDEYWGR